MLTLLENFAYLFGNKLPGNSEHICPKSLLNYSKFWSTYIKNYKSRVEVLYIHRKGVSAQKILGLGCNIIYIYILHNGCQSKSPRILGLEVNKMSCVILRTYYSVRNQFKKAFWQHVNFNTSDLSTYNIIFAYWLYITYGQQLKPLVKSIKKVIGIFKVKKKKKKTL